MMLMVTEICSVFVRRLKNMNNISVNKVKNSGKLISSTVFL